MNIKDVYNFFDNLKTVKNTRIKFKLRIYNLHLFYLSFIILLFFRMQYNNVLESNKSFISRINM